jgi:hypothetical protein
MKRVLANASVVAAALLLGPGCSATSGPPPLSYLALQRPEGAINSEARLLKEEHKRGGWYFWNKNFRPAPDLQAYLEEAQQHAGTEVLRDVDVVLNVPFALDILFFGYNVGTDEVTLGGAGGSIEGPK